MINADPLKTSDTSSLTPNQCEQQVQRILKSATFRNAVTLQQLLQFLTARVFEGGADGLKEYTIGVEAFGRPQDFDPKTDTIVRVQIHRLRQKLTEYYEADGSRDPILVEIPKGHYLPTFEPVSESGRNVDHDSTPELNTSVSAVTPHIGPNIWGVGSDAGLEKRRLGRSFLSRTAITAAAVMVVFATGFLIGKKQFKNAAVGAPSVASAKLALSNSADPVKAFWAAFSAMIRRLSSRIRMPFSFLTIRTIYSGSAVERATTEAHLSIHTWRSNSPQTLHWLPRPANSTTRMDTQAQANSKLSQCCRVFLDRWE